MEREVGGGIGMGNTCKPLAVSFQCMTKSTTNKKKKKKKDSTCNAGDPCSIPGVGDTHWRRDRLPTLVFLGFPGGSAGKESACNAEDPGSIPGLGRSPGEGKSYPLQYFGLENSMGLPRVRHDRATFIFFHTGFWWLFVCFHEYGL